MNLYMATLLIDYQVDLDKITESIEVAGEQWIQKYDMEPNRILISPSAKQKLGTQTKVMGMAIKVDDGLEPTKVRIGLGA